MQADLSSRRPRQHSRLPAHIGQPACSRARTIAQAWEQMAQWLSLANVWIPLPTERHGEILREVLLTSGAEGALAPDADLAALAIEHGLAVCSTDGDFARFPMARWIDPLRPPK